MAKCTTRKSAASTATRMSLLRTGAWRVIVAARFERTPSLTPRRTAYRGAIDAGSVLARARADGTSCDSLSLSVPNDGLPEDYGRLPAAQLAKLQGGICGLCDSKLSQNARDIRNLTSALHGDSLEPSLSHIPNRAVCAACYSFIKELVKSQKAAGVWPAVPSLLELRSVRQRFQRSGRSAACQENLANQGGRCFLCPSSTSVTIRLDDTLQDPQRPEEPTPPEYENRLVCAPCHVRLRHRLLRRLQRPSGRRAAAVGTSHGEPEPGRVDEHRAQPPLAALQRALVTERRWTADGFSNNAQRLANQGGGCYICNRRGADIPARSQAESDPGSAPRPSLNRLGRTLKQAPEYRDKVVCASCLVTLAARHRRAAPPGRAMTADEERELVSELRSGWRHRHRDASAATTSQGQTSQ